MTLLYFDELFLEHDTGRHPECAERLVRIVEGMRESRFRMDIVKSAAETRAQCEVIATHSGHTSIAWREPILPGDVV